MTTGTKSRGISGITYDRRVADQPLDLSEEALARAVSAARRAFDLASSDLDALARAKTEHLGDRSPIALARQALGSLPKADRADAGKRVNVARAEAQVGSTTSAAALRAERDAAVLVAERIDVTLPSTRQPIGARHPITILAEHIADTFVAMGWELAEGPGGRDRAVQLRRPELSARPPCAQRAGHFLRRARRFTAGAAHPHLAGADPRAAGARSAGLHHLDRPHVPHRRARRHPHPGVPSSGGTGGGQGADDGAPARHTRRVRPLGVRPQGRTRFRPHFFPFTEPSAEVDVWFANKKGGPGLGGMGWLRHGEPQCVAGLRH